MKYLTNIKLELAEWDGKSASDIQSVYDVYHRNPDFLDKIIMLITEAPYQKGATWLLKKWLESANQVMSEQVKKVYSALSLLNDWESKLHVLQCITYMPIGKAQKADVEAFLRVTLTDSNKFVRAWTYNGFYELAIQYPEHVNEVKQFFDMALKDEAASVKARIRNIMKKGF